MKYTFSFSLLIVGFLWLSKVFVGVFVLLFR